MSNSDHQTIAAPEALPRRDLLGVAAGLLTAGGAAADAAAAATGAGSAGAASPFANVQPDPVVALCEELRRLEAAQRPVSRAFDRLRSELIRKYGDVRESDGVRQRWEADPIHAELKRLNRECDAFTSEICDAIENILATPATSAAGISGKLQVAIGEMLPCGAREFHERVALTVLIDATRFLARVPPAALAFSAA
jgi:hypothetical protein